MTTPKAYQRAARGSGAEAQTIDGLFGGMCRERAIDLGWRDRSVFAWPATEYQLDPSGFADEVLGVELWEFQFEVLLAVSEHHYVAIVGGRKLGKDFVVAILALWFYCSFPNARVRFTAVTDRQVNEVFWLQVRQLWAGHGRCVACKRDDPRGPRPCPHSRVIEEEPGVLARTGLKSVDFRELVGLTAREAEGAAGISSAYQLNIIDEASAVADPYWEAVDGNMAGCAVGKLVALSNPTRTYGALWRAFHRPEEGYHTIQRSSRDSPNVRAGRIVVPGLATRQWIEKMEKKYGSRSEFVTVHVDGKFPTRTQGTIFDVAMVSEAIERWTSTRRLHAPLCIGIDVAGESGEGDESVFTVREGRKVLEILPRLGLKAELHVVECLHLIAKYRQNNQDVRVAVDRGGEPGAKVWGEFLSYRQSHWRDEEDAPFRLIGTRSSEKSSDSKLYALVRDELIGNCAEWMRRGGAIPDDAMLANELLSFRWLETKDDRVKLVDKVRQRQELGRSPDRADSLALACWGDRERPFGTAAPLPLPEPTSNEVAHRDAVTSQDPRDWTGEEGFDPYSYADDAIHGPRRR